jgi:hypothetical protein
MGKQAPDPRSQVLHDLAMRIDDLRQQNNSVILLIDANESTSQLKQLSYWIQATKLVDPHSRIHGNANIPATYSRGNKQIDYVFVSEDLCDYITKAGIMSFHDFNTLDHRPLFIDIDLRRFLGGTDKLPPDEVRGINSYDPRAVTIYRERLETFLSDSNFEHRLHQILHSPGAIDMIAVDTMDNELTQALLQIEHSL